MLPKGAGAQPRPDQLTLAGRVLNAAGQPVAGAAIVVRRADEFGPYAFWGGQVKSDLQGEFSFMDAEAGTYYISAEAGTYAPQFNLTYTLMPGAKPLSIVMQLMGALKLRLVKAPGQPLAGTEATVRLRGQGPAGQRFYQLTTDAEGMLNFKELLPSSYLVHVIVPGVGYGVLPDLVVKSGEAGDPQEVAVKPGAVLVVSAMEATAGEGPPIKPVGGATVALSLVQPAPAQPGWPVGGDEAVLYSLQQKPGALVTRDGDGLTQLSDVVPGTYAVRVFAPGYQTPEAQTVKLKAGSPATVSFMLQTKLEMTTLDLFISDPGGHPVSGREVTLLLKPGGSGGPAQPPLPPDWPDGAAMPIGGMRHGRTDNRGHLVLYPVRSGHWIVQLLVPNKNRPGQQTLLANAEVTIPGTGAQANLELKSNLEPDGE